MKLLRRWCLSFVLSNSIIFWLIGLNYHASCLQWVSAISTLSGKVWLICFVVSAYIGGIGFFAVLAAVSMNLLAKILPKPALIFPLAIFLVVLITSFLLIDSVVYNLYRFHFNTMMWELIKQGWDQQMLGLSSHEMICSGFLFVLLAILEIIYAFCLWKWLLQTAFPISLWLKRISMLIGLSLLFSYCIIIFTQNTDKLQRPFTDAVRFIPFYNNLVGLWIANKEGVIMLQRAGEARFIQPNQVNLPLQYGLAHLHTLPPKKPLNLLIIVIDAWRYDMLRSDIMPHTRSFADQAWNFRAHYSGGNATGPGIFSLFYGIPATYWASTIRQKQEPVLLEALKSNHYQFGIFASASLRTPAFDKNVFVGVPNLTPYAEGAGPFERDRAITNKFQQFITKVTRAKDAKPFFSFLFYDLAHSYCYDEHVVSPLKPIKKCERFNVTPETDLTPYFNRYKNALMLIDQQIQIVLASLSAAHLLDKTLVIITGDHGEEFNDNHLGYWGHAGNFTPAQTQVPLIVHWPGNKPHNYSHRTSHYDIAPTLLNRLLNVRNPMLTYSVGQDLLSKASRPYWIMSGYMNYAVIEPNRITTIFPQGNVVLSKLNGQELTKYQLDIKVIKQAFYDTHRFYQFN